MVVFGAGVVCVSDTGDSRFGVVFNDGVRICVVGYGVVCVVLYCRYHIQFCCRMFAK